MQSKATTVKAYLAEMPPERRAAISAVRDVILKNLDKGYEEGMSYGMIGYYVPHRIYPPGYHCNPKLPLPFAGLASQKNYMSFYAMSVYADRSEEDWVRERFARAGKKLDMGKCCIRFKKLEDVPLDVIGEIIRRVPVARCIEHYESALLSGNKRAADRAARAKLAATEKKNTKTVAAKSAKAVKKPAAKRPKAARSRAKSAR
ncbi:MAG: DUF1801 domain-containing protein [Phycisphaerales bacterium]|nr:DUF1801 domain-containing protein [Phycisphaerales bacterium]